MGLRMVKNFLTLVDLQRSRSNHQNFEVEYLENGRRKRESVHGSKIGSHVWAFEWLRYF